MLSLLLLLFDDVVVAFCQVSFPRSESKMAAGGNGEPSEKGHNGKEDIIPGCQIWCKTRFEEIQGTVSAYDQANGVLVISILINKIEHKSLVQNRPIL